MRSGIYTREEAKGPGATDVPALSYSIAKVLLEKSPSHAWWSHRRLNPQYTEKRSKTRDDGKAVHSIFLEGDHSSIVRCEFPDYKTKAAQETRDAALAAGKIPVIADEHDGLLNAVAALRARLAELDDFPAPFTEGAPEQTLVWQEPNGVWCKAVVDWMTGSCRYVDDLKTTWNANPGMGFGHFGRTAWNLGYDLQGAFYRRGVKALTGVEPTFRLVAFEIEPPYSLSVLQFNAAARAVADAKAARAIALWGDCMKRNEWPGYPPFAVELDVPPYELARAEAAAEEACF